MKILILGNAGAGKTTLAAQLMRQGNIARLSLDEVAFGAGAQRRPLADSVAEALRFVGRHPQWIVEGCYADIIEPLLAHCEALLFLNPGVATCIAHCRQRPWEPEKFASRQEQDAQLAPLLAWVAEYESRADEYGLRQHQRVFEGFNGRKRELRRPPVDAAGLLAELGLEGADHGA